MKKYLFIVLLVGIGFGQEEHSQRKLDLMRARDSLIQLRETERKYFENEIEKLKNIKKERDSKKLETLNDEIFQLKKSLYSKQNNKLSVKSKIDLESFNIEGNTTNKFSMQYKDGKISKANYENKVIYLVKGEMLCENGKNCKLIISWFKNYLNENLEAKNEDSIPNSIKDKWLGDPLFDSFLASKSKNNEKADGSIWIADIEDFISAIGQVNDYSFGTNDTEVEYSLEDGKIYKEKNQDLLIYGKQGNELPVKFPLKFIEKMIEWNDSKPSN